MWSRYAGFHAQPKPKQPDFPCGYHREVIALALQINEKAGKAIKHVKTVAQANLQDAADASQGRDKAIRVRAELRPDVLSIDATLIEFREWLATFKSYFYSSNLQHDHISGQQAIYSNYWTRSYVGGLHQNVEPTHRFSRPVQTQTT